MTANPDQDEAPKPRRAILTLKLRPPAEVKVQVIEKIAPVPKPDDATDSPGKTRHIPQEQFQRMVKAILPVIKEISSDPSWRSQQLWDAYLAAKPQSDAKLRQAAKIVSMAAIKRMALEDKDPAVVQAARSAAYAAALVALVAESVAE